MVDTQSATTAAADGGSAYAPLRRWLAVDLPALLAGASDDDDDGGRRRRDEVLLHQATVAFGLVELLRHARARGPGAEPRCDLDNFAVRVAADRPDAGGPERPRGVAMLAPRLAAEVAEPAFLRRDPDGGRNADPREGRYLEADVSGAEGTGAAAALVSASQREADASCRALGALLHELFSRPALCRANGRGLAPGSGGGGASQEPTSKKARRQGDDLDAAAREAQIQVPTAAGDNQGKGLSSRSSDFQRDMFLLAKLELPSSICMLVQSLLECGEDERPKGGGRIAPAYNSLETVSKDLHLLLLDPCRFLFDPPAATTAGGGSGAPRRLSFRKHKLYGREAEVSLITDAFCRVSSGRSEALLLGGFSGSGKSRLVGSLTERVAAHSYVLTHKFDQGSKEQTLLEVISLINDLCLLIRDRSSPASLDKMVNRLTEMFGTDLPVLARMLPNIEALVPGSRRGREQDHGGEERDDQMDLRSVRFILQRFMRVVSSAARPVVLFLDDLQWCHSSAFAAIEGLLGDASGSSCCFFVGSYRSNEVAGDHAIFRLANNLLSVRIPVTTLSLKGLGLTHLNDMVSDALGTFPRVCKPLSDIVFQKTKGNPFFVLEFMRSLHEGRLLKYDAGERRWAWDEDRIGAMDVTGNVLHILSTKMSGLPESMQTALKVAACFGIVIKERVIGYLTTNVEYSDMVNGLRCVVADGFMTKVGSSGYKFSHDKVREAAYSLIPNSEKNQYHFRLGMALYTTTKSSNVGDILFPMTDQINHGIHDKLNQEPELMLDLARLNERAGIKAVDSCDYVTAQAYLKTALSLLPKDHWKTCYHQSHRMYFSLAKAAYACGAMDKAQEVLQEILRECTCTEDKLQAYYLLVTIFIACGKRLHAYTTCHDVLTQLGETIPQLLESEQTSRMIEATSKMVRHITGTNLLEMKEMDAKLSISIKFYSLMAAVSFFVEPNMLAFLACRSTTLVTKHGICKHSILALCQYAAVKATRATTEDIQEATRLGKAAMFCLNKRFHSTEVVAQVPKIYYTFYGFVAYYTENLQLCANMLRQGFDAGMSAGDSATAFLNSVQHIKTSFIAGEKLPTLLKQVEYYLTLLDLYKHELVKTYLLIFRDTLSTLIDKGESTSSNINQSSSENDVKPGAHSSESMYFHRALQAFWLGHHDRCKHYSVKVLQSSNVTAKLGSIMAMFIHGLNSLQLMKRQKTTRLRVVSKKATKVLKAANSHSQWNFCNKVHLLEAEHFSRLGNLGKAKASYDAAITSARSSRFVHEQGLACELAGLHYKEIGDPETALDYLKQAKQCYTNWGSQMKVNSINHQLENLR